MMTGVNELRVNAETMLIAVNYWLEHQVFQTHYNSKRDERSPRIEAYEIRVLAHTLDGDGYQLMLREASNNASPRGGAV